MKIVFSFLLFLLSIHNLSAQVPETFLVDTINSSVKQTLPFDRPFILSFKGPSSKSIYSAFLFEWVVNGGTRTLKQKKVVNGKATIDTIVYTFIEHKNVFNGSDMYIPAQPPNKNFAVLLAHRFDGDLLNEALQAGWYLFQNDASNADKVMNNLNKKVEDKVMPVPGVPLDALKKVSAFASVWLDTTNRVVDSRGLDDVDASIRKGFTNFYNAKLQAIYGTLSIGTSAPACLKYDSVFIVVQAANTAKLSTVEFGPLVSLLSRSMMISLLEGTVAFQKDLLSSQVKIHNLPGRLKNLNTSLTEIEKLRQYCELAQAQLNNSRLKQLIADLETLRSSVESNRDNLKGVSADILSAIAEDVNLIYNNWAFAHNEVWDLKTKGSYRVIPDLGIATIFGIGNEKSEVIVRPYLKLISISDRLTRTFLSNRSFQIFR